MHVPAFFALHIFGGNITLVTSNQFSLLDSMQLCTRMMYM